MTDATGARLHILTDDQLEAFADRVAAAVIRKLQPTTSAEFVTVKVFAAAKNVCELTVRRMIAEGMPVERVGRRGVRIPLAAAETWLANRRRGA